MDGKQSLNHKYSVIGWGALFIWWGVVILIDPLTIGMGAIGTGLIMLGVNAARALSSIPAKRSTTFIGSIALVWGALATIFNPSFGLSFAILLIIIGLATIGSLLSQPRTGIYT